MLFEIRGKSLNDNSFSRYTDQGEAWYTTFNDKISEGDTVIKRVGELNFYIHKRDTVLRYSFECNREVYD